MRLFSQVFTFNGKTSYMDWSVLLPVLLVAAMGILMVLSASMPTAEYHHGQTYFFFKRHVIYWLLGSMTIAIMYHINPLYLAKWSRILLLASLLVVALVWVPGLGKMVNGSQRWIGLGGLTIQPSEFAKLFFLIYVSDYIVKQNAQLTSGWSAFSRPLLLLIALMALLLLQPDYGTAAVLVVAVMAMLFLAGAHLKQFMILVVGVVVIAAALIVTKSYRLDRTLSFIDPWKEQYGNGYQQVQSLIAFGRGGIDGVGFGNSVQKLLYLPEAHTDFVFAIWAEEMGLMGSILLISLLAYLVLRVFMIAQQAYKLSHYFSAYLLYGLAMIIGIQVLINVGGCLSLLPVKGLTLPLVSYGGSSLLVMCAFVGIILRVSSNNYVEIYNLKKGSLSAYQHNKSAQNTSIQEAGA